MNIINRLLAALAPNDHEDEFDDDEFCDNASEFEDDEN